MQNLTKAEEQIMHILWDIEKGFLKEIVAQFPEPKPANTTVATVIRVLVKKEFVGFTTYGSSNQYYPAVSKSDYFKTHFKSLLSRFFGSSATRFASFFSKENDLSISELEEIKKLIEQEIEEKKGQ